MYDINHIEPRLFERLAQIRVTVEGVSDEVSLLRDSIRGPESPNGERTSAEDMRIQLRQAVDLCDDLLYELTPLQEIHIDQALGAPLEVVMTKRKSAAAAQATTPVDIIDRPIDIINDRLGQAHATLDLLLTLTSKPSDPLGFVEELCDGTLHNAIHSAMLRISEAVEAVQRLGVDRA